MKKLVPLLLFLGFGGILLAQQLPASYRTAVPVPAPIGPGHHLSITPSEASAGVEMRDDMEVIIGNTFFDLQTNGSTGRRMAYSPDEDKISATWLFGLDSGGGFPGRGTAYNAFENGAWGGIPDVRLEGETRSGYPAYAVLGDGTEVNVSHFSVDGGWRIGAFTKAPGETEWMMTEVPTAIPFGEVWAKVAAGGADGQTIHVISITLATAFGGEVYEGLDQHLLYYRSQDGGMSWDVQDFIVPGCDSTAYTEIDAEAYAIDAQGETVAFTVLSQWGDAAVFKSEDNGDTWEKTVIHEFPIDRYDGTGYTSADIPEDPNAPDSLAIATVDNAGDILIDPNGMVHVWTGQMYVNAEGANFFYFPGTDGLAYWNESYGEDSLRTIALLQDFDNSDSLELAPEIGLYFMSLSSMPSVGIDENGHLYVAYAALHELYVEPGQDQNYRHVFLITSTDGGQTWGSLNDEGVFEEGRPYDVINPETTDPDFIEFLEGVFPALPRNIDDRIRLMYQQDFAPGMHVFGDEDESLENFMVYLELEKNDLVSSTSNVELAEAILYNLYPNPTADQLQIEWKSTIAETTWLRIFNWVGTEVLSQRIATGIEQTQRLNVSHLPAGIYSVQAQQEDGRFQTEKLVISK